MFLGTEDEIEGSDDGGGSDEELKQLKSLERDMEDKVASDKSRLLKLKTQRREEEKRLLRENISRLKQEAEILEKELQKKESEDTLDRSRKSSKSLPDTSEYQTLLKELITKPFESHKSKKNSRFQSKQFLKNKFQDCCITRDGKVKLPSAKELKELALLVESSETKESAKASSTTESTEDSSSESTSKSSNSDSSSGAKAAKKKNKLKKKKGKLKSGRVEVVDEMDIVKTVKYPHAKLDSDFVTNKKFDSLPFHHLVAGELELISRKNCKQEERMARIEVLKYLAYHFAFLDTEELREQYDSIMKKVERGELNWSSNLGKKIHKSLSFRRDTLRQTRELSDAKIRQGDRVKITKPDKKTEKTSVKEKAQEEVIYCADYNKNKCSFSTSHLGRWGGRDVMKLHICRVCLSENGQKKGHPEGDESCPSKKS